MPLSLTKKIGSIIAGPVLGLLPPNVQENITSYDSARIMSTTSRIVNGAYGLYSLVSLGFKIAGADIDPTNSNTLTYVGLGVAADSIVREVICAGRCYFGPPSRATEPFGSALISITHHRLTKKK